MVAVTSYSDIMRIVRTCSACVMAKQYFLIVPPVHSCTPLSDMTHQPHDRFN